MIVARRLFGLVGIKGKGLTAAFAVVALHPHVFHTRRQREQRYAFGAVFAHRADACRKMVQEPHDVGDPPACAGDRAGHDDKAFRCHGRARGGGAVCRQILSKPLFGRLIAQFSAFAAVSFSRAVVGSAQPDKKRRTYHVRSGDKQKKPQYIAEYPHGDAYSIYAPRMCGWRAANGTDTLIMNTIYRLR